MTPSSPLSLNVCRADYASPAHAAALVALLDVYARDPMGGGQGLSEFAKANLVPDLAARPQACSVLAFAGYQLDPMMGQARFLQKLMV